MWWKVLVGVIAAGNAAFGLWSLGLPARAAAFVGFQLEGPAATGEMRAVYGGLILALGAVMAWALRHPAGGHWLQALGLCFLGLVLGRAVSLVADGVTTWNAAALVLEALTAALLLFAGRKLAAAPG